MNQRVVIASDSTSDLNAELIKRYDVKIVPLTVHLGDAQYRDGIDIDPDMIYRHYEQYHELPKTAAPNLADFDAFFKEQTEAGNSVVLFTISAEMSSTYNSARLAAEKFDNVFVIDTRNLSTGGGLLVCVAGDMALEGRSAAEIIDACQKLIPHVDASFVVDDLEFLHKGGRCSAVAAFGANLLQLKPCISVHQGKMVVGKKYRGKFSVVLGKYIADRIGDGSDISVERIFVTHAGCDEAVVTQCVEQVKALAPFKEVQVTRAGCTISSHCGRNTLGVLFIRKSMV